MQTKCQIRLKTILTMRLTPLKAKEISHRSKRRSRAHQSTFLRVDFKRGLSQSVLPAFYCAPWVTWTHSGWWLLQSMIKKDVSLTDPKCLPGLLRRDFPQVNESVGDILGWISTIVLLVYGYFSWWTTLWQIWSNGANFFHEYAISVYRLCCWLPVTNR